MSEHPRIRQAVRAVVLDPEDRCLLVRFDWDGGGGVWAPPGGGIGPEESPEEALRRELLEEVGLAEPTIGPVIWTRLHLFPFVDGSHDGQEERYYLIRTGAFEPTPAWGWDRLREESMTGLRWWTLADLEASDSGFAPTRLPSLLSKLLDEGPPSQPFDAGV